jgi:hypothetical protein
LNRLLTGCAALTVALLGQSSPSSSADDSVREYLDETTAATITVTTEPLIFARERTDLAVNARDYIILAPIEVNQAGSRTYYWFAYIWSTIDKRNDEPSALSDDQFVLLADDRPIVLRRDTRSARQLGIAKSPIEAPGRGAVAMVFSGEPEAFDYVAQSSELQMQRVRAGYNDDFPLWRDGRAALRAFVQFLGGGGR